MTRLLRTAWVSEFQCRVGGAITVITPFYLLGILHGAERPADLPEHGWYRVANPTTGRPDDYIRIVRNAAGRALQGAYRSDPPEGMDPESLPTVTAPKGDLAAVTSSLDKVDHLAVHFAQAEPLRFSRGDPGIPPEGPLDDAEALAIYRATAELRDVANAGYNRALLDAAFGAVGQQDADQALQAIARVGALFRRRRMIDAPTFAILNMMVEMVAALSAGGKTKTAEYLGLIGAHARSASGTGERLPINALGIILLHAKRILGTDGLYRYAMARLGEAQEIQRIVHEAKGPGHAAHLYDGAYHAFLARFILTYLRNSGGKAFDVTQPLAARAVNMSDELTVRFSHATINAWQALVGGGFARHAHLTRQILQSEGAEAAAQYTRTLVQDYMFFPKGHAAILDNLAATGPEDEDELDRASTNAYLDAEGLLA